MQCLRTIQYQHVTCIRLLTIGCFENIQCKLLHPKYVAIHVCVCAYNIYRMHTHVLKLQLYNLRRISVCKPINIINTSQPVSLARGNVYNW